MSETKVIIQKTSKPIKLAQALVKIGFLFCLILAGIGYYGNSTICFTISMVAVPFLILAFIAVRWWKWWQHD